MYCGHKSFQLVWRCHQLLFRFLAKGTCPECHVSHACGPMIRMIPGPVHGSLGICLTAQKNCGKSQLGESMKAVLLAIASKGFPYLQMRLVGSYNTSGCTKR